MTEDSAPQTNVRVFVVEDEFLLAITLEEDLRRNGFAVVGPFNRLGRALRAVGEEAFDLAIVDVNLNGEMAFPLIDELRRRQVPTLILSGYGLADLPARFHDLPRLAKPAEPRTLLARVRQLTADMARRI